MVKYSSLVHSRVVRSYIIAVFARLGALGTLEQTFSVMPVDVRRQMKMLTSKIVAMRSIAMQIVNASILATMHLKHVSFQLISKVEPKIILVKFKQKS